jgi:3-hydroxyanthranilate 3,4-dioxygenase
MLLRIVDGTEFRDVPIREGEMFLLPREPSILPVVRGKKYDRSVMPANTPHNPVRFAETIGIVIELQRPEASLGLHEVPPTGIYLIKFCNKPDRLRWYCREPTHATPFIIREEAFHVTDLGAQLKPYITNWIQNPSLRKCPQCGPIAAAV